MNRLYDIIDKLNSTDNLYKKYKYLCDMENTIDEIKSEIVYNKEYGMSYYNKAANILNEDIKNYLCDYIFSHNIPGSIKELGGEYCYQITLSKTSYGATRLLFKTNRDSKYYKDYDYNNMSNIAYRFPKYTILKILDIETDISMLIKDDFDRFLKLREENPEYFLPYIGNLLEGLDGIHKIV